MEKRVNIAGQIAEFQLGRIIMGHLGSLFVELDGSLRSDRRILPLCDYSVHPWCLTRQADDPHGP